ncbi:fusion protein [Orthorubulavirus simiae]|uniref:Fusion glycoprotein F0 n=3 Tax=Simian virus 41 TaxID=3052561 RepID=FUS_SV41|nr:fusion protein [Orthorubulavirus simiae]P25181.1 RecName: Full=Fusion glycoprotein F0; Contains: RecName: Full=Fusion glycoprotein F2; Contains: RecName: Full=Fusion glycoprotein F1; Flags: Precursor [Orthorubulavirus simiae]AAB19494.1 carboxy-terminal portion of fusion protein [Orthorubulavirus simiae]CAA45567.1 fusion protein [Orthorubulavirus simiae]
MRLTPYPIALTTLMIALTTLPETGLGIARDALSQVGVIQSKARSLMYYSDGSSSFIVVKLLPTLPTPSGNCNLTSITAYNTTLFKLLTPLMENLDTIVSANQAGSRRKRFAGVVVGLAALGVATAAQVTAAVAVVKANANAAAINKLAASIQSTNAAISDVISSTRTLATAIQAVQDHVNGVLASGLTEANCRSQDALIGSILNLYLTELTTIFHNQIVNPALTPLSIQALRIILGSTLPLIVESRWNTNLNTAELLSSGLLTGQIISISPSYMQMVIQITVPTFVMQPGAKIIDLVTITANRMEEEVLIQVPPRILEYANEIQAYTADDCVVTPHAVFCKYNDGSPISDSLYQCLKGNLTSCVFTPVVGNYLKRFAFANGVMYVNCKALLCRCADPPMVITQDDLAGITVIDITVCREVMLDTLAFKITSLNNVTYGANFSMLAAAIKDLSPLDLSAQLAQVNKSLASAEEKIAQSSSLAAQAVSQEATITVGSVAMLIAVLALIAGCTGIMIAVQMSRRLEVLRHLTDQSIISNHHYAELNPPPYNHSYESLHPIPQSH